MSTLTFTIDEIDGDDAQVEVKIEEVEDGDLKVTLNVLSPALADIRAFFFDLSDNSLFNTLTATGDDVTDQEDDGDVNDLGNGANINGSGQDSFEVGIEIGTQGIGTDDFQMTMFTISSSARDLTLADIAGETVAVRLTSVLNGMGEGGRGGSSKLQGEVPELGSLSGRYFCDEDRDGLDNDGPDNGVDGVAVELLNADGEVIATTSTDANGDYSFTGLPPGTYGVKFTDAVSGKTLTTQNVDGDASDDIDSDAEDLGDGMSQILNIQVVAGQDTPDNDAGVFTPPVNFRKCDDPDAVLLDFAGFAAGTVVDSQYDGVTISAQRNGPTNTLANDAMIFDSANPTGDDPDLATPSQGNVLIISEDNDSSDPDDSATGGTIVFEFENPAEIFDLKTVDTEEGGEIRLFDANSNSLGTVVIPAVADGELQQVLIDTVGVSRMEVELNGSGAIDDICYVPGEPEPASLKIIKDARPDSEQDFAFTATGDGVNNFMLDDDGDNNNALSNMQLFSNLAASVYVITEADVAGWNLADILIEGDTDGGSVIDLDAGTATIDLDAGEDITVKFINDKLPDDKPPEIDIWKTGQLEHSYEKVMKSWGSYTWWSYEKKTVASYLYTVQNISEDDDELMLISLIDDNGPLPDFSFGDENLQNPFAGDTDGDGKLDKGETWVFKQEVEVPKYTWDITNTATVTAMDADGNVAKDSDDEALDVKTWKWYGDREHVNVDDRYVDKIWGFKIDNHDVIDFKGFGLLFADGSLELDIHRSWYGADLVIKGNTDWDSDLEKLAVLKGFFYNNHDTLKEMGIDWKDGLDDKEEMQLLGTIVAHEDASLWA